MQTTGYAAHSAESGLAPFAFERRQLRENDVVIEILYCGVCHSDLHQSRNDWKEWGPTNYPVEIVGRVVGDRLRGDAPQDWGRCGGRTHHR
jgi:uncharacterized zinc-type alcohol dehydrogenase-like protein